MKFFDYLRPYRNPSLILFAISVLLIAGSVWATTAAVDWYNSYRERSDAVLLTRQVKLVIEAANLDYTALTTPQKEQVRASLRQFTDSGGKIRRLYLLKPDLEGIVSNESLSDDSLYQNERVLQHTSPQEPLFFSLRHSADLEEYEIIWPLAVGEEIEAWLRAVLWNTPDPDAARNRTILAFFAASLTLTLIVVISSAVWKFFPRSRINDPSGAVNHQPAAQTEGIDDLPEEEGGSVFSSLNKLYDHPDELNQSFQQSEEQINSMMRVLNQGLLIMDMNMNIITHNEYLIDVLQIRSTSSAHRRIYDVMQKNPRILEMYRRAKEPLTHEVKQTFVIKLLNERTINAEILVRPFHHGEEIYGIAFYVKNVDVLNELEGTLQRSMKYGVISQLASSIGHEIRNPLSSLAIHTEIVDNMVEKSVTDEVRLQKIRKSIGILNSEVERLQKLIDQFFNLAKAQEIVLTYENINEVMRGILDLVQQQAFEKNVDLKTLFGKDMPMVRISKDQLKQVIINLILNGFDAMPEGGEMGLRTHFHEGKVIISIRDTGDGIPDNVRDNIFDLYFTTKESGGGIGLAISRKIIEAHEGRLWFESKPGIGTVFHIELPTTY